MPCSRLSSMGTTARTLLPSSLCVYRQSSTSSRCLEYSFWILTFELGDAERLLLCPKGDDHPCAPPSLVRYMRFHLSRHFCSANSSRLLLLVAHAHEHAIVHSCHLVLRHLSPHRISALNADFLEHVPLRARRDHRVVQVELPHFVVNDRQEVTTTPRTSTCSTFARQRWRLSRRCQAVDRLDQFLFHSHLHRNRRRSVASAFISSASTPCASSPSLTCSQSSCYYLACSTIALMYKTSHRSSSNLWY